MYKPTRAAFMKSTCHLMLSAAGLGAVSRGAFEPAYMARHRSGERTSGGRQSLDCLWTDEIQVIRARSGPRGRRLARWPHTGDDRRLGSGCVRPTEEPVARSSEYQRRGDLERFAALVRVEVVEPGQPPPFDAFGIMFLQPGVDQARALLALGQGAVAGVRTDPFGWAT
jgi:hypothetical protein